MKCTLVVGHTQQSPGAVNRTFHDTEFAFNKKLAHDLEFILNDVHSLDVETVYRDTYETLPGKVNATKPDFVISLHCNGFTPTMTDDSGNVVELPNTVASGTEMLFYHKSAAGKRMAEIFQEEMMNALHLKNRGIKPRNSEDRGGYLLRNVTAPVIIVEPFFFDNDKDYLHAQEAYRVGKLVPAYIVAILKCQDFINEYSKSYEHVRK